MNENIEVPGELPYHHCLNAGFVALVDVMGDDAAIVQAARVSYGKGTKTLREDSNLLSYLLRNKHTTPFEMCEMKFLCRMPIFVARQWIRHRTANVNEYSGRYSVMKDIFFVPHHGSIATQSEANKQGRTEEDLKVWAGKLGFTNDDLLIAASGLKLPTEIYWAQRAFLMEQDYRRNVDNDLCGHSAWNVATNVRIAIEKQNNEALHTYRMMLEAGVSKELARVVLPLTQYTEWYWKIDIHNLLHFLRLRLDKHAQAEMRVFAEAIALFVQEKFPTTWEVFRDMQDGCFLTGQERLAILGAVSCDEETQAIDRTLKAYGFSERRIAEFWAKVQH